MKNLACEACIQLDSNKSKLWALYQQKDALSQSEFRASSSKFFNTDDKESELNIKYADEFFKDIVSVKQNFHRDYFQHFFMNLSPAFMGKEEHLKKFKDI